MSMIVGFNRSNVRRIELKNADGTVAGTISISTPVKKKKLRLQYNFKEISTKILRTKTSGNARQVMTNARQKVAQLRRLSKSDNYDENELNSAILHAEAMARVAKKRMKHLQEEERAGKHGGPCEAEIQEKTEEKIEEQRDSERQAEKVSQEMEKLMQEYQELMENAMEELEDAAGMDELSEELMRLSFNEDMDPEDLEQLKKKHRASEMREIVEADMKYLKAMFDRLQREKQSAGSSLGGSFGSGGDSGVSLQLGGADIPVQAPAPDAAAVVEGGAIDTSV